MNKRYFKVQRSKLSGIGIVISMVLILSLMTGAAMPPGTGAGADGSGGTEAMSTPSAGTAGDIPRGVTESVKTRMTEARASFDGAMTSFEEGRAEAEADIDNDDEDWGDDDATGDDSSGINPFSVGDEGADEPDWADDADLDEPGDMTPEIEYSADPADYRNITDFIDINNLPAIPDDEAIESLEEPVAAEGNEESAAEGLEEPGTAESNEEPAAESVEEPAAEGIEEPAAENIEEPVAESLEVPSAAEGSSITIQSLEEPGGSGDAQFEGEGDPALSGEITAMASSGGLYMDLAEFWSVADIEYVIDLALHYTDNLLIINTGRPFNAGTKTINVDFRSSKQIIIWQAAYYGGDSSTYGSLINLWGNGSFAITPGGSLTYGGKGDAAYISGSKSVVYIDGGKISTTYNKSNALSSAGETFVFGGSVSATTGRGIDGNYVGVAGGTLSATSGRAISCKKAEVIGGTIKASNGYAISTTEAIMTKGTVSATTGCAISANKATISGGTVSTTSGSAFLGDKVQVLGGTVKATANKGVAIDSDSAIIRKGTVSATTGWAIYTIDASIIGGTVKATAAGGRAIKGDKITVTGGTISATTGYAIYNDAYSGGFVVVKKGTVKATTGKAIYTDRGSIEILGGKVSVTGANAKAIVADDVFAEVDVSGGTVTATAGRTIDSKGDVCIDGGKVSATKKNGVAIYGGRDVVVYGGQVTSKDGYAIDTEKEIRIYGELVKGKYSTLVEGAYSRTGDITIKDYSIVRGAYAADGNVTVSDYSVIAAPDKSAIIAKGNVKVDGACEVINNDKTAPAINSDGDVEIDGHCLVVAFGGDKKDALADAVRAGGKVTATGGMLVAIGSGAAISSLDDITIKDSAVYGYWGNAIQADGAAKVNAESCVIDSFAGAYGIDADGAGNVSLSKSVVAAEEGVAIRGGDGAQTLDIDAGFIFAGGERKDPVIEWGNVSKTLISDAIECKWESDDLWNRAYLLGGKDGLAPTPAGDTVEWAAEELGSGPNSYRAFGVYYKNNSNEGFHEVADAMVFNEIEEKGVLSISPNHVIITEAGQTVDLVAALNVKDAVESNIKWSMDTTDAIVFDGATTGKRVKIETVADITDLEQTVRITAVYEAAGVKYTAESTVEIMPGGIGTVGKGGDTTITLLEKKVTVNRARIVGARVPILITKRTDLEALSLTPVHEAPTGQMAIDDVKLEYEKSKNNWVEVPLYEARICPTNDRFIEISGELKAKKRKNVRVSVHSSTEDKWFPASNKLELAVSTKYPKITLKTGGTLNLRFPEVPVSLTATSPDGLCSLVYLEGQKAKDDGKIILKDDKLQIGSLTKAATIKTRVDVAVSGYKPMPASKWKKLNVKVVKALPKLKLSKKSATLLKANLFDLDPLSEGITLDDNHQTVEIDLLSGDKKVPLLNGYEIKSVTSSNKNAKNKKPKNPTTVDVDDSECADGKISVSASSSTKTGNTYLIVTIADESDPLKTYDIYLPFKVTVKAASGVTLKASPKAATVNINHKDIPGDDKIVDIPFTMNTTNLVLDDWKIETIKVGTKKVDAAVQTTFESAIKATPSANKLTLSVDDETALADLTGPGQAKTYALTIKSPKLAKTFAFNLTVSDKIPTFTTKAGKGKIDVAKPGSEMDVTVALKNTASGIDKVTLWDVYDDSVPANECKDFEVVTGSINGMKFKIIPTHDKVVPKITQKVGVKIELANGDVLRSWDENPATLKALGAPLSIKPVQTVPKATQSAKSITLYKTTPLEGKTVEFGFKKPEVYTLGEARISKSSLTKYKDGQGFELVRCGEGAWTIRYEGDTRPVLKANGKKLNTAVTLTIELWPEGTYEICSDPTKPADLGKPVALKNVKGVDQTKPAKVKVKVNLK